MFGRIIILVFAVLALSVQARGGIPEVLESVERNNISLQSQRQSADAKSYEARMGNSLDDLSVSYSHLWGNDAALGETGEFEVAQSFDFPTAYANRRGVAKALAEKYNNEYMSLRQEILLEAKELCIELFSLRQTEEFVIARLDANEYLRSVYDEKFESGDATLVEKTRISNEYLLLQESILECQTRIIEVTARLETLNGGQPLDLESDYNPDGEPFEELWPFEEVYADYSQYAPQLLAFRLQESVSERELKLSRAQALPKFELGYKHEFAPGEKFNGVTAGISIPLFSNRHNVRRAKAVRTAAALDMQAAEMESKALLSEMYDKAVMLTNSLANYEAVSSDGYMSATKSYLDMLTKMLDSGSISVVDYFAEVYALYDVVLSRIRLERDYRTLLARINMIYL